MVMLRHILLISDIYYVVIYLPARSETYSNLCFFRAVASNRETETLASVFLFVYSHYK